MAGISFTTEAVIVDGVSTSFAGLYSASQAAGNTLVTKSGSIYVVNANIVLKNNAKLSDTSKTVSILGESFDIQYGSTFQVGTKYSNSSVGNGCTISMPNLINEYGFGGLDPTNSGNFLCYGSIVDAYCYWSFFKGTNIVDIIQSTIDGYGRVSGPTSALRTVTIRRAHGKYGALLPSDNIAAYSNVTILDVDAYNVADDLPDLRNLYTLDGNTSTTSSSIDIYYVDAKYAYSDLLTVLDSEVSKPIKLYGGSVDNGYNISRSDPNKNDFYHLLKFSPYIQNTDGVRLTKIPVVIKNKLGVVEFSGVTGDDGSIDVWLTRYQDLAGPTVGEYLTPHTVTVTYNGEDIVSIVNMTDNLEDFPLIMHPQLTINSDSLATLLTSVVMAANTKLEEDLGLISNATNTILLAVSDKVTATDTILKRNGITIKL